jgi:hypothetical protein
MQPAYLADHARSCAVFCLRFASRLGGQTSWIQQKQDWKLLYCIVLSWILTPKLDIHTTAFPALLHFLQVIYGTIFSEGHDDILHLITGKAQRGRDV